MAASISHLAARLRPDLTGVDPEIAEEALICFAYQVQHGITLSSEWGHRDVLSPDIKGEAVHGCSALPSNRGPGEY